MIATITPGGGSWALAPDGAAIAVVTYAEGLRTIDVATGTAVATPLPCHPQTVTGSTRPGRSSRA